MHTFSFRNSSPPLMDVRTFVSSYVRILFVVYVDASLILVDMCVQTTTCIVGLLLVIVAVIRSLFPLEFNVSG